MQTNHQMKHQQGQLQDYLNHWTQTYETHAQIVYEADAPLYQNEELTRMEMEAAKVLIQEDLKSTITDPILDLACGIGRHSRYHAKCGRRVAGVDGSSGFLDIAERLALEEGLSNLQFLQCDIRKLPFLDQTFGSVFLSGNSFGYFSDRENERVLTEAFRVLKRGGVFCFDLTDREQFLPNLKPYSKEIKTTNTFGMIIDERWREWDEQTQSIRCRKRHSKEGGQVLLDTPYTIRLYSQKQLEQSLRASGFGKVQFRRFEGEQNSGEVVHKGLMHNRLFVGCVK